MHINSAYDPVPLIVIGVIAETPAGAFNASVIVSPTNSDRDMEYLLRLNDPDSSAGSVVPYSQLVLVEV